MNNNINAAHDIFWGLGDDWWKQIYDGQYHRFGKNVFDEGLHDGPIEPGFYESLKKAIEYTSTQLGKPLTLECYQQIHHLACQHFANLDRILVNVDKENLDRIRSTSCECFRNLVLDTYEEEDPYQSETRRRSFVLLHGIRRNLQLVHKILTETANKEEFLQLDPKIKIQVIEQFSDKTFFTQRGLHVTDFLENGNPIYEKARESMQQVLRQIASTQKSLNLPKPFISMRINASAMETRIYVDYNYQEPKEIEEVLIRLIQDYNDRIDQLPKDPSKRSQKENDIALQTIAELFQNLEWLHPFFDGQGRTDLDLLGKLLTENGFNPSILFEPYYSTFEPLENWVEYLKKGMEAWRIERGKGT